MSTIMYQRHVHIAESAADMGSLFVRSPQDIQIAFLVAAAVTAQSWDWPTQCRFITDDMRPEDKICVTVWLETLIEHLREGAA